MHSTARRMKRTCLLIGWIGAGLFSAPMVVAQDVEVRVRLYALAHFPLLGEDAHLRYPTGPTEYKRLTEWFSDKWGDRGPENFDLVAIIENVGTQPVGPIELRLTRDRKIGENWDIDLNPNPSDVAIWEGLVDVETRTVGTLDADSAMSIWFGPFSAYQLLQDLPPSPSRDLYIWPWEAKYEVTLECDGCSPMTASASFVMVHPPL